MAEPKATGEEVRPLKKAPRQDQRPGEEPVQVNDPYSGGGPPPDPNPAPDAQHQTPG